MPPPRLGLRRRAGLLGRTRRGALFVQELDRLSGSEQVHVQEKEELHLFLVGVWWACRLWRRQRREELHDHYRSVELARCTLKAELKSLWFSKVHPKAEKRANLKANCSFRKERFSNLFIISSVAHPKFCLPWSRIVVKVENSDRSPWRQPVVSDLVLPAS